MKRPQFNLCRITADLIGMQYELGLMDCFMLIMAYFERRGFAVPKRYKGWTLRTYKRLYLSDPEKAKALMVRYMDEQFDVIDASRSVAGDVLLLSMGGGLPFLAIDTGNGNIMCATESRGVLVLPRRYYEAERAWRCRQLSL